jgi:hypothetical protein
MTSSATPSPNSFVLAESTLRRRYLCLVHTLTVLFCAYLFPWPIVILPLVVIAVSLLAYRQGFFKPAATQSRQLSSLAYRGDHWLLGMGAGAVAGSLCWCQLGPGVLVAKFDLGGQGRRQFTIFSDQLSRAGWRKLRALLIHARPVDSPL